MPFLPSAMPNVPCHLMELSLVAAIERILALVLDMATVRMMAAATFHTTLREDCHEMNPLVGNLRDLGLQVAASLVR